jgi:hypothetical protein
MTSPLETRLRLACVKLGSRYSAILCGPLLRLELKLSLFVPSLAFATARGNFVVAFAAIVLAQTGTCVTGAVTDVVLLLISRSNAAATNIVGTRTLGIELGRREEIFRVQQSEI